MNLIKEKILIFFLKLKIIAIVKQILKIFMIYDSNNKISGTFFYVVNIFLLNYKKNVE